MQSSNIGNLVKALVSVQAGLKPAMKDATNPFFKTHYATLASIWDNCRELLAANGLAVIQRTAFVEQTTSPVLITTLAHISGEFIEGAYLLNPVKPDPQSLGSAVSYARRYALMAIIGIVAEDDDGHEASSDRAMSSASVKPQMHKASVKHVPNDAQIHAMAPMPEYRTDLENPETDGWKTKVFKDSVDVSHEFHVMPMGKHKGKELREIPRSDLETAYDHMIKMSPKTLDVQKTIVALSKYLVKI